MVKPRSMGASGHTSKEHWHLVILYSVPLCPISPVYKFYSFRGDCGIWWKAHPNIIPHCLMYVSVFLPTLCEHNTPGSVFNRYWNVIPGTLKACLNISTCQCVSLYPPSPLPAHSHMDTEDTLKLLRRQWINKPAQTKHTGRQRIDTHLLNVLTETNRQKSVSESHTILPI